MDFFFEDDADDVGSDIEGYCPKCKGDTSHTVITKYEDEIRRVQCSPCGDVHGFRKPRGEIEDEIPEPVAAKKRANAKKPTWQEARAKVSEKAFTNARPYSIRDKYSEGNLVAHPKFGVGFVTEISENKVEITFQDERRVLIHNRPDLAAQMPAIAAVISPSSAAAKGRKKQGTKATESTKAAKVMKPVKIPASAPQGGKKTAITPVAAKAKVVSGNKGKGTKDAKAVRTITPKTKITKAKAAKKAAKKPASNLKKGAKKSR